MALSGLYHCAKIAWNRCNNFDDMHVFRFREFVLKTSINQHDDLGVWPRKWRAIWKNGTSLRESASLEPSCVKIRQRVWPVGKFQKSINKKWLYYTHVPRSPSWADVHLIWFSCRARRLNHRWQMFRILVEGCRFCGGRKLKFPIDKASRR